MEVQYDTFNIPTPQKINEPQQYGKRKRIIKKFLSVEPTRKRDRLQGESAQKGRCYVEESVDTNWCGQTQISRG